MWTGRVRLPLGVDIHYRYCVCLFVDGVVVVRRGAGDHDHDDAHHGHDDDGHPRKKMVVRRWETDLIPRRIPCHGTITTACHRSD